MDRADSPIADKLTGADLRSFAECEEGTRAVVVELNDTGSPAAPPSIHLPGWKLSRRSALLAEGGSDNAGTSAERMDALERELVSLHPVVGPIRADLARAFFLTVTPALLRALTRLPLT